MPARSELFGLVSHARINPALQREVPFENVFPGYYWTRSTCSRWEDQAWHLHLGGAREFRGMNTDPIWFGRRDQHIRELDSLVDISCHHPVLPARHPFGTVPDGCWFSATSAYEPSYAAVVYWKDGAVGAGYKHYATFIAWAVCASVTGEAA